MYTRLLSLHLSELDIEALEEARRIAYEDAVHSKDRAAKQAAAKALAEAAELYDRLHSVEEPAGPLEALLPEELEGEYELLPFPAGQVFKYYLLPSEEIPDVRKISKRVQGSCLVFFATAARPTATAGRRRYRKPARSARRRAFGSTTSTANR